MPTECRISRRGCRRGFVIMEVVVGSALIMLTAILAARAAFDYQRAAGTDDLSRALLWAADAQLQRCQAGAQLDSKPPEALIAEEITLKTTRDGAEGQWEGFELITVTAETVSPAGRPLRAQVRGYVRVEDQP
jgi:hypothetical protein